MLCQFDTHQNIGPPKPSWRSCFVTYVCVCVFDRAILRLLWNPCVGGGLPERPSHLADRLAKCLAAVLADGMPKNTLCAYCFDRRRNTVVNRCTRLPIDTRPIAFLSSVVSPSRPALPRHGERVDRTKVRLWS